MHISFSAIKRYQPELMITLSTCDFKSRYVFGMCPVLVPSIFNFFHCHSFLYILTLCISRLVDILNRAFDSFEHGVLINENFITQWSSNRFCKLVLAIPWEPSAAIKWSMNSTSWVPQGYIVAPFLFCLQMRTAKPIITKAIFLKYVMIFWLLSQRQPMLKFRLSCALSVHPVKADEIRAQVSRY